LAVEQEEASILKLSMLTLKEHYGLNPGKLADTAKAIGYQLGQELAHSMSTYSLRELVGELASYWSANGIGRMSWEDEESLLLKLEECSDCLGRGYGAGYPLCPFKEGLLEAVLTMSLQKSFKVKEIECCGTGASRCLFKISAPC
jgi:uncharacterized protein